MGVFLPLRNMIHIVFLLPAGASLTIQTIIATSAMSGWRSVFDYTEKFSLQRERKKERKMKSSYYSSFSGFFPSMLVPCGQLSYADSGIITTSASPAAVCAVKLTVAGPAVTGLLH